jgi:prepilin-type N-terminal cleavage/methylation domain-containing protein
MRAAAQRDEGGFGLIELLIAMTVLSVAAFTILAAFSSGMATLQRSARITTAAAIVDAEMERMRAVRYCDLWVSGVPTEGVYTEEVAYNGGGQVTESSCAESEPAPESPVTASADRVGTDGRTYRVDTYVVEGRPRDTAGVVEISRPVKTITLVVRDPANASRVLTRQSSTFDESTGLPPPDEPADG